MPHSRHKLRNVGRVFATSREIKMLCSEIALKLGWGNVDQQGGCVTPQRNHGTSLAARMVVGCAPLSDRRAIDPAGV
jgi:hypothetical protein